jgi:hypothetical protein
MAAVFNTQYLVGNIGFTCIVGSAALRLHGGLPLNPDSDIDSVFLLNGEASLEESVTNLLVMLYGTLGNSGMSMINSREGAPLLTVTPVIEISVRKTAHESVVAQANQIASLFNRRVPSFAIESVPPRDPEPHTWKTSLMNQSLYPYRILVLWNPDGRWLIKVQSAASIGQTTLFDGRTVLLYKDLYDINVYDMGKDISRRLGSYMAAFPPVPIHGIYVANLDMLLCQQIDLFQSKRSDGIKRNMEVLRVMWNESRYKGVIRELFQREHNTNSDEVNIVDKFLVAIGATSATASAKSGGKRRTKTRRVTKKKKRRNY